MTSGTPRTRRPRDPDASRAAILGAAREAFTELGFDGASIREIARRAGTATGLVLRHFETKRQLFVAAFPVPDEAYDADSPESALDALVARVVGAADEGAAASPFVALIRSAATRPEAAADLRREMQHEVRTMLGAERSEVGVELVAALLIGVSFVRHVLATGPLATASDAEVARLVGHHARTVLGRVADGGS